MTTDLLTTNEAAAILGVTAQAVRLKARRGKLPAVRLGYHAIMLRRADVVDWQLRRVGVLPGPASERLDYERRRRA